MNESISYTEALNYLVKKHKLKNYKQFNNPSNYISEISISEEFKTCEVPKDGDKFDLVFISDFIDNETLKNDFELAEKIVSKKGLIVLINSNPKKHLHDCGTVWKFVSVLRTIPRYTIVTLNIDRGFTIIRVKETNDASTKIPKMYFEFHLSRNFFLNLIDACDYDTWYTNWKKFGNEPIEVANLIEVKESKQ